MTQCSLMRVAAVLALTMPYAAHAATAHSWPSRDFKCALACSASDNYREYDDRSGHRIKVQAPYASNGSRDHELLRKKGGAQALVTSQGSSGIPHRPSHYAESSSPRHAIENITHWDFLLIDLGEALGIPSTDWTMAAKPLFSMPSGTTNGGSINELIKGAIGVTWAAQNSNEAAPGTGHGFVLNPGRSAMVSGALTTINSTMGSNWGALPARRLR